MRVKPEVDLQRIVQATGLTQAQIAERLPIGAPQLWRILSGESGTSRELVQQILDVAEIPWGVDDLFYEPFRMPRQSYRKGPDGRLTGPPGPENKPSSRPSTLTGQGTPA